MGTPQNLRSFWEGCCFEVILKIFLASTECYPNRKLLIEQSLFCRSPLSEKCVKLSALVAWKQQPISFVLLFCDWMLFSSHSQLTNHKARVFSLGFKVSGKAMVFTLFNLCFVVWNCFFHTTQQISHLMGVVWIFDTGVSMLRLLRYSEYIS